MISQSRAGHQGWILVELKSALNFKCEMKKFLSAVIKRGRCTAVHNPGT